MSRTRRHILEAAHPKRWPVPLGTGQSGLFGTSALSDAHQSSRIGTHRHPSWTRRSLT